MTVPVDTLRRPRIKPEHRPYRTIDGNVRIGSVIHGIGAEIEDPQGWVWTLVETMAGWRQAGSSRCPRSASRRWTCSGEG
ncbi:hypothetical protein [Streptomyces mirabilis]|uniref:hypothetical protein n=1 Tax=Streptomyces mirabilis TaxID=68239 RepID=UPI0036C50C04